ncbi:MAG: ABC transporter permease subunit [Bacillota bacterium]|nr:ABC transporter permease subunit [Bacillota bacterium]
MLKQVSSKSFATRLKENFLRHKSLYLISIPVIVFYLVFRYLPIAGNVIAFQKYRPGLGVLGSKFVGWDNFKSFIHDPFAARTIKNTIIINLLQIVFGFPAPIILALLLNELRRPLYKRVLQTASYLPHFISMVVVAGMIKDFTASDGIITDLCVMFGMERQSMLGNVNLYRTIYIASGVWQGVGWGSILYLATISTADPALYEAAMIDGANRWQQMVHVTLPVILPIMVVQLILRLGSIMSEGSEKTLLLYSPLVYEKADIISTYEYRRGLIEMDFSYGAAVGLFNSFVNIILLVTVNRIARKLSNESLW